MPLTAISMPQPVEHDELRYRPGYEDIFGRLIPKYTLNEIHPAMKRIAREEMDLVAFDVGANTGIYSAALMMHSGPRIAELHMFEPLPGNADTIRKHRARGLYGEFERKLMLNQMALGDQAGWIDLRYEREVSGYASAAVTATLLGSRAVSLNKTVSVECVRLDDYCDIHDVPRIHFLKIDVEGYEMAVLRGAERMLSEGRIDVIAYEFGTHQMARREFFRDFWDLFQTYGYKSLKLRPNGWAPAPIESYHTSFEDFSKVQELLAVRP